MDNARAQNAANAGKFFRAVGEKGVNYGWFLVVLVTRVHTQASRLINCDDVFIFVYNIELNGLGGEFAWFEVGDCDFNFVGFCKNVVFLYWLIVHGNCTFGN